jgi:DNA-directed RNA polymerase specialized sigma24 family protein
MTAAMQTNPVRVGVVGAGGRMGQAVCAAVAATHDLELVAAVDPHATGTVEGVPISHELRALADADVQVRCIVLTGAGQRVFCAGGDLGGMTGDEIAAVLGTTPRTVDREWRYARAWMQARWEGSSSGESPNA